METSGDSSLFSKYGAVWLTMLGMAVGGIAWVFGLAGSVENNREQIAALQAEVANRRGAMSLIENVQRDVTRIEQAVDRIQQAIEQAKNNITTYKELTGRQDEHIDAVDERVDRIDDRLVQIERTLSRRPENGLGHNK